MKKIFVCLFFGCLIVFLTSLTVLAEESRLPKNIEYTQYEGTITEAEYSHDQPKTRGVYDFYTIKGDDPEYEEYDVGAHYYAFSDTYSDYSEVYTRVNLPTALKQDNNYNGRNAYISLGLMGTAGWMGMDIGIRNDGSGWHPYYYESYDDDKFVIFDDCTVGTNAKSAVIIVAPINTTSIQLYVQFLDALGNEIDYFWQIINVKEGNFTTGYNGQFACCFYRFASLVNYPNDPDNQSDGTYMLGGNFNGLALYNRNTSTYENWGMSSNLVLKAWEVSPENITVSYTAGSDTETFDIDHRP